MDDDETGSDTGDEVVPVAAPPVPAAFGAVQQLSLHDDGLAGEGDVFEEEEEEGGRRRPI